jgi:calcineurin-like phosphoesterase family protein
MKRVMTLIGLLAAAGSICVQCGAGPGPTTPPTSPGPAQPIPDPNPVPPVSFAPTEIFVGAGDIGWCGSPGTALTGKLLDSIGGTVFAAGDNAYMSGTAQQYRDCYDPGWGRHKGRTFPAPGNHEYESPGAAPYFDYFGTNAVNNGPPRQGYYSFKLGNWHVISLNSNIDVSEGSPQGRWLLLDLAANPSKCTIAYWHHPLFSSGQNGDNPGLRAFWRILYTADVDVVVVGHDHLYERFAPQDPDGRFDPGRGIRQFIAGTGGALLYNFVTVRANSERRISAFGVLKLTLEADRYNWDFIPVSGEGDRGNDVCH